MQLTFIFYEKFYESLYSNLSIREIKTRVPCIIKFVIKNFHCKFCISRPSTYLISQDRVTFRAENSPKGGGGIFAYQLACRAEYKVSSTVVSEA